MLYVGHFVVYCDFECLFAPLHENHDAQAVSETIPTPSGVCMYTVCRDFPEHFMTSFCIQRNKCSNKIFRTIKA